MQELDVSKPMMIEHKGNRKLNVKRVSTVQNENGINHVFEVSDNEWDYWLVTDKYGAPACGTILGKVVNIPEKTFSWDRPYRIKNRDFKILFYFYHKRNGNDHKPHGLLVQYQCDQPKIYWYTDNGKLSPNEDLDVDLENYEPDERYEIEPRYNLSAGVCSWSVYKKTDNKSGLVVGWPPATFQTKEDAELFKRIKEQGL